MNKVNVIEFPDKRLIEEEAGRWIIRFDGLESPSQQDIAELRAWLNTSPAHRQALLELATLWNDMSLLSELKAHGPIPDHQNPSGTSRLTGWMQGLFSWSGRFWAAPSVHMAVGAFFLLAGAVLFSWNALSPSLTEDFPGAYVTGVGEQKSTTLTDGSMLWLNTNSRVSVEYSEARRRIVLHQGEAHFQVEPDPDRPFEVYAGSRLVRAVGTAFSVFREADQVRVMVTEGKVDLGVIRLQPAPAIRLPETETNTSISSVEEQQPGGLEVLGSLEAGQSVVLSVTEVETQIQPVINVRPDDMARRLSWREGRLVFAGEPLSEVVREVSRYTDVQIEIMDSEIRQMSIGGQFRVGETEALFNVLEQGFGLQISRLDDQLVQIHARR